MFVQRVVGLELGRIVYDGPPDGLTAEVLTEIYGEEDWSATIRKVDGDEQAAEEQTGGSSEPATPLPGRERLAGMT